MADQDNKKPRSKIPRVDDMEKGNRVVQLEELEAFLSMAVEMFPRITVVSSVVRQPGPLARTTHCN